MSSFSITEVDGIATIIIELQDGKQKIYGIADTVDRDDLTKHLSDYLAGIQSRSGAARVPRA